MDTAAWAADITTPITINSSDNKTINDNFAITSLGSSKYALGTASRISVPNSITFNGADTIYSYATFGYGMATFNNDLTLNMDGGKQIYGLGSIFTLKRKISG